MFEDDFFDEEEYNNIEFLLTAFEKVKNGERNTLDEDDFEYLIDYFEMQNERENLALACEISITLFPFSTVILLRNAEWLMSQKKYGQAEKLLDHIEELDPNNLDSIFLKSDILLEQDKIAEAAETLERNVEKFGRRNKVEILLELTDIYDELANFEKVYITLKRVLDLEPKNEEALLRICFWAEITGMHEDSIELHKHIIDKYPYSTMAWYNLGFAYQGLKLYEKAVDAYDYCLAIDDKFEYAYRNQGDAYIQLKQFKKAIEVLETHLTIAKPEDVVLEAIGYCWERQKDYAKARHFYRKALQLNPQDDQFFYKIGETYSKESQWEKAIKSYSVALHINKENVTYCLALGNCLMEIGAEKEALVCYLNAVQLRPDIKSTWQSLIKSLYVANYLDEALSQLIIAEEHCGFKVEFVYYKAAILLSKGKTKEAVLQLENALTLNEKKLTALKFINKDIVRHPAFAEVLVKYKKKK